MWKEHIHYLQGNAANMLGKFVFKQTKWPNYNPLILVNVNRTLSPRQLETAIAFPGTTFLLFYKIPLGCLLKSGIQSLGALITLIAVLLLFNCN